MAKIPVCHACRPFDDHTVRLCDLHAALPRLVAALREYAPPNCPHCRNGISRVKEGGRGNRTRFLESDCQFCAPARKALTRFTGDWTATP